MKKESSPLTDVMEFYGVEMTREEYIATNYLGEPDDCIPVDVEATFPSQFRRSTLLETPAESEWLQ
jgi:hypothetical protein